jgi:hypothetical protein
MSIRLIIALIVAVGFAASHWKAYVSGKTAERAEWNLRTIKANDDARELERLNRQSKEIALENRTKQIMANVAAADRARLAADSLRSASERSLQAATANHSACVVSASTHAKLLDYCEREYRGMAQTADGHTSDIKALIDAWPN